MRYAYYPGCVALATGKELDISTRKVTERLGIELVDVPEYSCCGSGIIDEVSLRVNSALNARNLALTESKGLDMMTICSFCHGMMLRTKWNLAADRELAVRTQRVLSEVGLSYSGKATVKHLLQILVEDYGLDKLKERVAEPLSGLKVAPFYGCQILRPRDVIKFDDPENPHSLEDVIRALGAEPVAYPSRIKCCGFPILFVKERAGKMMAGLAIKEAMAQGAEIMVTPCPLCHISLDMYQRGAEEAVKMKLNLPVLHLAQLVGLALGMGEGELGLSRHLVSPFAVLAKLHRQSP